MASPPGNLDPDLDARLVARCQAGEPRAWEALVRRHQRLVWSVSRSYRLSDEDAGDVFQEVFAALIRSLARLRDGRALVRWLSVTSDRLARTAAVRSRREQAMNRSSDDPAGNAFERLAASDEPIGADLERLEREAMVRLAMGALSDRCVRLLRALYYEDPTPGYAELSERLGVPIGSLGPTRARCFDKLRLSFVSISSGGISGGLDATSLNEQEPRGGTPERGGSPKRAHSEEAAG